MKGIETDMLLMIILVIAIVAIAVLYLLSSFRLDLMSFLP
jgi:hypothetical protein